MPDISINFSYKFFNYFENLKFPVYIKKLFYIKLKSSNWAYVMDIITFEGIIRALDTLIWWLS